MCRSFNVALFLMLASSANAQFFSWGWGPPISVIQVGSNITCTVFDPLLNMSRTQSYSSVAEWSHDDGVVATVSGGGVVRCIIYDIALASFRDEQVSSISGTMVINNDGVVAWVTQSGNVGGAIYHPFLHQWIDEQFSSSSGNQIQNRDGVVSWVSSSGNVGAAVFDPQLEQWQDEQFSSSSGNIVQNRDGIVAWVSTSGNLGAAVYDPSISQWQDEQFSSSSGNVLVLGQGVVAWKSISGNLGGAAYNWNSSSWNDEQFSSAASNTVPMIVDGTVQWTNSNGPQKYGYTGGHVWQSGVNTAVQCEYFAEQVSGSSTPRVAYLWCMTIGASTYNHLCGDGHQITRRWAWKEYAEPGSYDPEFNAFSSISNTQCFGQVAFSPTRIQEADRSTAMLVTVANGAVSLTNEQPIGAVRIFDARGVLVHQGMYNGPSAVIDHRFGVGTYLLRAASVSTRFVVVE